MSSDGTCIRTENAPQSADNQRIKSLDGIRAIAVAMVLLAHGVNHPGITLPVVEGTLIGSVIRNAGHYGVFIFFALSGYLITTLLCKEYAKAGEVSLTRFWFRRALRIFPVFYCFVAVVLLLVSLGVLDIRYGTLSTAATYLLNYRFMFVEYPDGSVDYSAIGHLWTLAVEEQFYLFFPILFAVFSPRKVLLVTIGLVLATPGIRLVQYLAFPGIRDFGPIMGHTMFGVAIAIGCVWALARAIASNSNEEHCCVVLLGV